MGLRMKSFNIMGVHWKIRFLGRGLHKKLIYRSELPKKEGGSLGQFADLRGGGDLEKKREVFLRLEIDSPMMNNVSLFNIAIYFAKQTEAESSLSMKLHGVEHWSPLSWLVYQNYFYYLHFYSQVQKLIHKLFWLFSN